MFTRSCLCTNKRNKQLRRPTLVGIPYLLFLLSLFPRLDRATARLVTLTHAFSLYSSHPLPFIFTHSLIHATQRYARHFAKGGQPVFTLIPFLPPYYLCLSLFFLSLFLELTFDNLMPHAHANLDFDGRAQRVMSTLSCNC